MRLNLLFLLGGSLVSLACGDTGEPAASSTGAVSSEKFPALYLDTYCGALAPCCTADSIPYDDAYCRTHSAFDPGKYAALVNSPKISFDPVAAGRCIDALKTAGCSLQDDLDIPGCEGVFVGKVAVGDECLSGLECAREAGKPGRCRGQKFEDGPGVCVSVTYGNSGSPCQYEQGTECVEGLVCSSGLCVPLPKAGSPCEADLSCDGASLCAYPTQVCKTRPAAGEPCEGDLSCQAGFFCNHEPQPSICSPLRRRGEACSLGLQCASGRCERGLCRDADLSSCSEDESGSLP